MVMIGSVRHLDSYVHPHFKARDIVKVGKLKGNKATNYNDVLLVKIPQQDDKNWCVFFTLTYDYYGVSGIDGVAGYVAGYWDGTTVPDYGGKYCGHLSAETSYRPCCFFDSQKLDDYMRGIFGALYHLDVVTD